MFDWVTSLHPWPGRYQSAAPPYHLPPMLANTHWLPSSGALGSPKNGVVGHWPSMVWLMQKLWSCVVVLVTVDVTGQSAMPAAPSTIVTGCRSSWSPGPSCPPDEGGGTGAGGGAAAGAGVTNV